MPDTQDSANFKSRDAASYDPLTAEFDRFTRRLTQPLAERMVDLANMLPTDRVLDLGAGTGIVALAAAARPSFEAVSRGSISPRECFAQHNREPHGTVSRAVWSFVAWTLKP